MQARIECNEEYPVYYLLTDPEDLERYPHLNLEVPDTLVLRYERALQDWREVQDAVEQLKKAWLQQRKASRGEQNLPYVKEK